MSYRIGALGTVQHIESGTWIPTRFENGAVISLDEASPFVQAFEAWLAEENAPIAADPAPAVPDVPGFVNGLKAAMGGAVAANALMRQYPMFYDALSTGTWADVQALIIDAHTTGALTDSAYAAFKALAAQHNIPVVLP